MKDEGNQIWSVWLINFPTEKALFWTDAGQPGGR